jgi:hypothetical protein
MPIFIGVGRSDAAVVKGKDFGGDKCAVIAVGEGKDTQCPQQDGKGIHKDLPTRIPPVPVANWAARFLEPDRKRESKDSV